MIKLSAPQQEFLDGNSKVWKQLTFDNEHSEVRVRVAHFLNIVTEGKAMLLSSLYNAINDEHKRTGNLSRMAYNLRNAADEQMWQFIRDNFDEDVYRQIHECF